MPFVAEHQRLDFLAQPLGHLQGHLRWATRQDGGEFFAANAPEQVATAQYPATAFRDAPQHLVALQVAVGVVDVFEIIDVQQQERQRGALHAGVVEGLVGEFEEVSAVAALGQYVGGGEAMEFQLKLLLFGDVFGDAHHDQRFTGHHLLVDVALVTQPADLPVSGDDAVLAVLHGALFQHTGQAVFGVVEVFGVDAVAPFTVVGQQQAGGAAKQALVRRAHIQHTACFPIDGPQHGVHADQQGTEQLLTLTQPLDFTLSMHKRQQGRRRGRARRLCGGHIGQAGLFVNHRYNSLWARRRVQKRSLQGVTMMAKCSLREGNCGEVP